jgi:NAD(P) transhydrogenase
LPAVRGRRIGRACRFEAPQVYDSDEFSQVTEGEFPKTLIVVGGGVIGLEYASMAAALGSEVIVVEARNTLIEHVDHEITEALMYHLRRNGVTFRMGETVTSITANACGTSTAYLEKRQDTGRRSAALRDRAAAEHGQAASRRYRPAGPVRVPAS